MESISPQQVFADHRVSIFGGKGGVGKTTSSVAAALAIARDDRARVLILSTDPAHSIDETLADVELPTNVIAHEFDADSAVDDFRTENRDVLRMFVDRGTFFDSVDTDHLLELGLPGMDEAMAFLAVLDAANDRSFTHIVVDTAPTGHTLRLLEMPQTFGTWVGFLEVLVQKDRALRARFSRNPVESPMDRFLTKMNDRIARGRALWRDSESTAFYAVTAPESLALAETQDLLEALDQRDIHLGGVVINRLDASDASAWVELEATPLELDDTPVWSVPDFTDGIDDARLTEFWDAARSIDLSTMPGRADATDPKQGPELLGEPLPSPVGFRVIFVAGKGGVGKTTVACATALELAAQSRGKVGLVSTDPAHSLSDALGTEVGSEVTDVSRNLVAVEIDAEAEFDILRSEYVEEVSAFFNRVGGRQVDVVYDRAVFEGLISFAPPGVDEAMGLLRAMEILEDESLTHLVIDSAPTGHFLRLMEMPELLQNWIRAIFRILQKYKRFIRLPRLSDRLVRVSRQLRRFRAMLVDGEQASVFVVGQLSRLAWNEARSIARRCEESGMAMPVVVLNRVESGPRRGDAPSIEDYKRAFKASRVSAIAAGAAPRGVDALRNLGASLYMTERA